MHKIVTPAIKIKIIFKNNIYTKQIYKATKNFKNVLSYMQLMCRPPCSIPAQ